jgi:heme O synthase-like polyprenyltransferase
MLLVLGIPTLYMIIRTTILQTATENPRTIAKVVKFNMLKWVTSNNSTFLQIFIWSSFLLISSIITISNSLQGDSYPWVGITGGVLSLLSIWGLMKTFEIETDKVYPNSSKHSFY